MLSLVLEARTSMVQHGRVFDACLRTYLEVDGHIESLPALCTRHVAAMLLALVLAQLLLGGPDHKFLLHAAGMAACIVLLLKVLCR